MRFFLAIGIALIGLAAFSDPKAEERAPIDRDALIFFIEDGLAASKFIQKEDSLLGALSGTEGWLYEALYTNVGVGEALRHARSTLERADRELPELRQRLEQFPAEGPSFPPVLYWYNDWIDWRRASLDLLTLQIAHLKKIVEAVAAGDNEAVYEAQLALQADREAFQPYFDAIGDATNRILPEGHPDRILSNGFGKWEKYVSLISERSEASDEAASREVTLKIAEELYRLSKQIKEHADALEGALAPYGDALRPYIEALTLDSAKTDALLDHYLRTYAESADALRGIADVYADTAAHELRVWRDGITPELYAGYAEFQYREEPLRKRIAETWTARAQILVDAIAR